MEINIKVNEQEILKNVMAGMNEEDISKELILDAKIRVERNLREKINLLVDKIAEEKYRQRESEIYKEIVKNLQAKLKTNKSIKKILESDRFDELMADVLWEYVDGWLSNQEINLILNTPKKKKITYVGKS